jgi:propanol-preferring alcohol dehydrogenase
MSLSSSPTLLSRRPPQEEWSSTSKRQDSVSFTYGAAGTDAGMTSRHAVIVNGQVTKGTKPGIIGFGGLGQIDSRVAVLAGAEVYVAEVNEDVWQRATPG